jgi:SAM-dependent methyltransferase
VFLNFLANGLQKQKTTSSKEYFSNFNIKIWYNKNMKLENFNSSINNNNDNTVQQNERHPNLYEHFLGISISELAGKKVLNIGSGRTGLLEKEMARKNIKVSTISPSFANEGISGKEMRDAYSQKPFLNKLRGKFKLKDYQLDINTIASKIQDGVPLDENSIDCILALYSVPLYLENDKEKENLISEIHRLLNEKGKASLYPIPESQKKLFSDMLEKNLMKFSFIEIPEMGDVVYRDELSYRLEIFK